MKKFLSVLLSTTMMFSLAACSNGSGTATGGDTEGGEAAASGEVEFTINAGFDDPDGSTTHLMYKQFEKEVEEKSGGRIEVNLYPGSILGSAAVVSEGVLTGTYQMVSINTSDLSNIDTKMVFHAIPYIFNSAESAYAAFDGEPGEIFDGWLSELGFTSMGSVVLGTNGILNNEKTLKVPADIAGIKIRCPEAETYIKIMELFGALPVVASWGELFTGLQQGTFNGVSASPAVIMENKFNEVCEYYVETNHLQDVLTTMVGTNFIETLPDDLKTVVIDAGSEMNADWRVARDAEIIEARQAMSDVGVEIYTPTEEEWQQWRDLGQPLLEEYYDIFGQEFIELCQSY